MSQQSYYFNLFKKFQVVNHVPSSSVHGAAVPTGGFDLKTPSGPLAYINTGSTNPAESPLWAILNSRALGNAGFSPVTVATGALAGTYVTMPPGLPPAWNEFQVTAPAGQKLVDVFGSWISSGHVVDTPSGVLGAAPPSFAGPEAGVKLFVCSMPGDQGARPGVPTDFWATSLIFLVDPTTGAIGNPATLNGGTEWYLAAVIGNRGNANAGRYINHPPAVQAGATVMVWNTILSPGVKLPSLGNTSLTDTNPLYEQYFLHAGQYDVVGFRLNVQTVYNGIIAALNDAVANGMSLGGLTPEQWVNANGAHLCAKVAVREQGTSFPTLGTSPDDDARVAQKNLAPFNVSMVTDTNPNIEWRNFVVGDPLFLKLAGAGKNTLMLQAELPAEAFQLYIGIPTDTFHKVFRDGHGIKGFEVVSHEEVCNGILGERAKPFPEAVILRAVSRDNAIVFPGLDEGVFLGMSLGIEYDARRLQAGDLGKISVVHDVVMPTVVKGQRIQLQNKRMGGFTFLVTAEDPRVQPNGKPSGYDDVIMHGEPRAAVSASD